MNHNCDRERILILYRSPEIRSNDRSSTRAEKYKTRSPGDEGEAAFANQLLDAPAKRLDAPRDMERLDRHVGRERIPFEAIEREQLLVHVSSPCSSLGR